MANRFILAATILLTISATDAPRADGLADSASAPVIASVPVDDSVSGATSALAFAGDSIQRTVVPAPHPAPVVAAPAAIQSTPRPLFGGAQRFELLFDLIDIDGDKHVNQRHLNDEPRKSNLCCVDAAWIPWSRPDGFSLGVSGNLGQWSQDLKDQTVLQVTDLLVASSLGYRQVATGPWARVDLGISTLFVDRRTVGVDWGVGGAVRAGWRFDKDTWALICGGAWDFRRYFNLDVKDVPALTLFAGAEL